MQKDLMREMLNLQEWQVKYLSELKRGQCIARVNSIEKPFALQTRLVERTWLTDDEIEENNRKLLESIEDRNDYIESQQEETQEEALKEEELFEEAGGTPIIEKKFCPLCGEEIGANSELENCETCSELRSYIKFLAE